MPPSPRPIACSGQTGGDVVLAHVAKPDRLGLEPTRQEEIENCLLALVPEDLDRADIRTRTFVTANIVPGEAIIKAIRQVRPRPGGDGLSRAAPPAGLAIGDGHR